MLVPQGDHTGGGDQALGQENEGWLAGLPVEVVITAPGPSTCPSTGRQHWENRNPAVLLNPLLSVQHPRGVGPQDHGVLAAHPADQGQGPDSGRFGLGDLPLTAPGSAVPRHQRRRGAGGRWGFSRRNPTAATGGGVR